ncbi:TetR/AcrR family transcriptional regulator [Bradyrhizobium sediminis]|uniref:TetR/AcrR family transcriptional regulator n=1 Tax=Bradyrhizobium sediminis TaxID=2840469 RepID=A0A975NSW8_9BRAD|nr:TetR/AcrR family transcriptional regulator [Bradyrhizobium sediminis]QWG20692.1 TetR/AcrR family transcriptional regulator [Bradyrhizobium sediminis]
MPKPSLKNEIIAAGLRVMFRKGYEGASVRDVVAEAGAPQGSFTNHFRSKEAFAEAVLNHYFDRTRGLVVAALGDSSLTPRDRLRRYLDVITDRLAADNYMRGCLIGDFSIEVSQASDALRLRLAEIYREWLVPFADCIAEGQRSGEIDARFSPQDLAEFLLASWEGAILRMKVERDPEPLERFKRIAFATVFSSTERTVTK